MKKTYMDNHKLFFHCKHQLFQGPADINLYYTGNALNNVSLSIWSEIYITIWHYPKHLYIYYDEDTKRHIILDSSFRINLGRLKETVIRISFFFGISLNYLIYTSKKKRKKFIKKKRFTYGCTLGMISINAINSRQNKDKTKKESEEEKWIEKHPIRKPSWTNLDFDKLSNTFAW